MIYLNMINFQTDKKLTIILPNTNRALAEVLKDASPKELALIGKDKDLKSIINSLLKESSQNPAADKTLLELVKNNPTLKELGNINRDIKNLLNSLKSDKTLEQVEKLFQKFLPSIKEINSLNIKSTLENSGVFLESKLKSVQNPQLRLNTLLTELLKIVQKSELPLSKVLGSQVKELLSSAIFKNISNESVILDTTKSPKPLDNLIKTIQEITDKFKTQLKSADFISTKEFESKLSKLEYLIEPKSLEKDNFKLPPLLDSVKQVISGLENSFTRESKNFIDLLNKIFKLLQSIEQSPATVKTATEQIVDKKIPPDIKNIIENIKSVIKESDSLFSKPAKIIFDELSLLNSSNKLSLKHNIEEILSNDFKSALHKAGDEISKSTMINQSEALKQVDKLLLQIDYYQLVSHLSNSSSLYIPFNWEDMQDGNISIKQAQKGKFYCDIDLKLKEYGELKLRLALYETNQLNIHINSESDELKSIIKENLPTLRKALIDVQITPREIRFFNKSKNNQIAYESNSNNLDIGFEVKV